jgi:hypothetical protein
MTDEQQRPATEFAPNWVALTIPPLLVSAIVGFGGLWIQVTKIDQNLSTLQSDITELKNDSRQRLTDLESRVRTLEMGKQ